MVTASLVWPIFRAKSTLETPHVPSPPVLGNRDGACMTSSFGYGAYSVPVSGTGNGSGSNDRVDDTDLFWYVSGYVAMISTSLIFVSS